MTSNRSASLTLLDGEALCEDSVLAGDPQISAAVRSFGFADVLALSHCELRRARRFLVCGGESLDGQVEGSVEDLSNSTNGDAVDEVAANLGPFVRRCVADTHLAQELGAYEACWDLAVQLQASRASCEVVDCAEVSAGRKRQLSECGSNSSSFAPEDNRSGKRAMSRSASMSSAGGRDW